jgi:hypothetical protein
MAEIKHIDVREFQEAGFLLEANRQFFRPHGLALEITRVSDGEGAPVHAFGLNARLYDELMSLVGTAEQEGDFASDELLSALREARRYEVGDCWISGVWDSRSDPEGVIFGGLTDEERAKVVCVAEERERHRAARDALFGGDTDVEPLDWEYRPAD